jgi:Zn ribbon nucleic-acid-binding protein
VKYCSQKIYQDKAKQDNRCRQCRKPRMHEGTLCDKCSTKQKLYYWTEAALKKYPELNFCGTCGRRMG